MNLWGAKMITIDQLLESVDLDFEPRFVTKGNKGFIEIHKATPKRYDGYWSCHNDCLDCADFGRLKIAEFDGKDWTECIYEVPRKDKPVVKIEKLACYELADEKFNPTGKFEPMCYMTLIQTINSLVDAVNELKGA